MDDPLLDTFEYRLQEIDAYLDLLDAIQCEAQTGPPKIGDATITTQQQRILYSSVYLQLYNLVEATATWCVSAVSEATVDGSLWKPEDLDQQLREEWVRATARTHVPLSPGNRLQEAVAFCDLLLESVPITEWSIERGGGGNWDDLSIEGITERLGCNLTIDPAVSSAAKRHIRDDKNSLGLVKYLRNRLAHGTMSFEECGDGVTVVDLRDVRDRTANYLREVVSAFADYIDNYHFLSPDSRPS
jgi:HEPN superfamily protein